MSKVCPFCQKDNKTVAHFCFNCGGILGELHHPVDTVLHHHYRIIAHLKKGGMANIYKAEDASDNNKVIAVKEMLGTPDNEKMQEQFIEWFEREMQLLSNLRHHGIPNFRDHFSSAGRYYLVMEYIAGKNLEDFLQSNAPSGFSEEIVLKWALEVSDILDYLHSHSPPVIHRDIKPSNLISRQDGKIMLVDFGIARFFSAAKTGTRIGTIGYIAPEHYKGHPEPRSDLYSLGVTLYQLLTGIDPAEEIPYNLPPIEQQKPTLSGYTITLIHKLIALKKENRFDSALDLMEYLKRHKVSVSPPTPTTTDSPSQDIQMASLILDKSADEIRSTALLTPEKEDPFTFAFHQKKPREEKKPTFSSAEKWSPYKIFTGAPKTPLKTQEAYIGRDSSRMILVREEKFLMGASFDDEALYAFEKPLHTITVAPFYIDKHPVTVGQFLKFLEDSNYKFNNRHLQVTSNERHPVVNVSWYDALFYAAWAGKRLPTEAEWEIAARGTDGRKYPWGTEWDDRKLNYQGSGFNNTTPVGIFPGGNSPYGCQDMLGNVWEWTLDNLTGYPYGGPSTRKASVIAIRGASFQTVRGDCRSTVRARRLPSIFDIDLGFRCAISVE